jgi:hypothetical protein
MIERIGWIALSLGALIAAVNIYLSFLRYPLYKLLGWEYRYESGIPAIGSLCTIVGVVLLWTPAAWLIALLNALFDTAGLPWFAGVMCWAYLFRRERLENKREEDTQSK